jgi:hypothetical protein
MAKASGAPDAPSGERQPTDERWEKLQLGIGGVSCSFCTNGVKPEEPARPLGFQPDDFATAPGDEDYTPLRQLVPVAWGRRRRAAPADVGAGGHRDRARR